jgi:uncharacterized membrane protein
MTAIPEPDTPQAQNDSDPVFKTTEAADQAFSDVVWSYRGYKLKASEFTTAMVHFFRAEVQRANVWRQRLDTTTNWAVVTTGASISISFSGAAINHVVLLINLLLVTVFLLIEARRYRYYEVWSYRVRLMETDFFAPMLVPPFHPSADWAEALAEHLLHPHFPISTWEAIGRRLRRNYLYIYGIIGVAWIARLWLFPTPADGIKQFLQRASIGGLPGAWLLAFVGVFIAGVLIFSILTARLQQASGEVLPRFSGMTESILPGSPHDAGQGDKGAWYRPSHRRKQLLTLIITDRPKEVAEHLMTDMRRGVTALSGVGMFTGQSHQVLLCALTVTEIPLLKELVQSEDPKAFVIVSPAQEIFGKGFQPLKDEESS